VKNSIAKIAILRNLSAEQITFHIQSKSGFLALSIPAIPAGNLAFLHYRQLKSSSPQMFSTIYEKYICNLMKLLISFAGGKISAQPQS
jgi:hypothetical protein